MVKKIVVVWLLMFNVLYAEDSFDPNNDAPENQNECVTKRDKELKECILNTSYAEQKKIFQKLSPEQRKEYLALLEKNDYEAFLDIYNEYDWMHLYEHLDDTEKEYWPRSLYEQRIALYIILDEAANGGSYYQLCTGTTDKLPLGKKVRKKIESFFSYEESEIIKKKFKAYMKKKFKV